MQGAWVVHTLWRRWRTRRRRDRREVNDLTQKSKSRPVRRLALMAAVLLLSALVAIPASGVALAQSPPPDSDDVTLVNRDRQMVERKKEGDFVARPILSRQTGVLYYAIRHPDTGDWLTSTYRIRGGEKQLSEGWEYTFEYPALDEQPELHPEQAYLLVLAVPRTGGGDHHVFHALIPVHQPKGLWDRVLGALDPDRWARAAAKWVIQGVHGTLRRGGKDRPDRSSRVRGVAVWATSSPEPLPS